MANRDDMVIVPRLGKLNAGASAPTEARTERRMAGSRKRGGIWHRLAKAKAAARLRRGRAARASRRVVASRRGASAVRAGAGASRVAGAGRFANPIGMIVAATVIATMVALRLVTGRSFENMGAQVSKVLLGDMNEEARAKMDIRNRFTGDKDILRIVESEGFVNAELFSIYEDLRKIRYIELRGADTIREDKRFQVNGTFDILIIRARKLFLDAFNGAGGQENIEKLQRAYSGVTDSGMF